MARRLADAEGQLGVGSMGHAPVVRGRSHGMDGDLVGPESAEDVLKRGYAKGEIDRDTCQQMMKDLRERG